ncbi:MAG TPA: hypothetical protein VM733_06300 [Thermoanaerobaculia bacterium]|nr:hypothetical protein [Thermoanaerobaculia bacterium]
MALLLSLTIYVSPEHPYSLTYDPDVWKSDGSDEQGVDLVLKHHSGKADAVLYVYEGATTLDALRESALKAGREVTPNLKVVAEERTKKGEAELLTMYMTGASVAGPVAYRGVYWAGPDKYVQIVATTTKETDADVKALLDGLSIRIPKKNERAFTIDFSPLQWRVEDDGSTGGTMVFVHTAGDTKALANAVRASAVGKSLKEWASEQSKALAPDMKIVREEQKTVGGAKVTMLQLEGTASDGLPIVMLGYFFRGPDAYVQAVTVTAKERFARRKADMTAFLDGLQIFVARE